MTKRYKNLNIAFFILYCKRMTLKTKLTQCIFKRTFPEEKFIGENATQVR